MRLRMRRALGLLDIPLAVALLAGFYYLPSSLHRNEPPARLLVTASGRETPEPLQPDRRLTFSGPLGETVVEIEGGGVRVVSSPCPTKVCMRSGTIRQAGQALACVPNRVALRLSGGREEEGVDAVVR